MSVVKNLNSAQLEEPIGMRTPSVTRANTIIILSQQNGGEAEKWYIYIIGTDQKLKLLHYALDLDDERARLLEEISAVQSGECGAKR